MITTFVPAVDEEDPESKAASQLIQVGAVPPGWLFGLTGMAWPSHRPHSVQKAMPFALIGSDTVREVGGRGARGRSYPWGFVNGRGTEGGAGMVGSWCRSVPSGRPNSLRL